MTITEALHRIDRLEREKMKWYSRAQTMLDALYGFRIDECWCDLPLGEHTEPCRRAQEAVKLG